MNERIKELYDRAMSTDEYGYKFDPEKFAELIVKECATRCEDIGFKWHAIDSTRASGAKAGAFECATELKKHFGVK